MKIRFQRDVQAETEGRNKGPVFKAGSVHDLPFPSAQRWLRRGVAVEVAIEARQVRMDRPMMRAPEPEPAAAEPETTAAEPENAEPEPAEAEPAEKPKRGRRRR